MQYNENWLNLKEICSLFKLCFPYILLMVTLLKYKGSIRDL